MADKQAIGISSLIALGLILTGAIVPGLFDSPQYYCEARPELGLIECDSFSKYVAANGKCIRDEDTNLICRKGWVEVIDDRDIPEEQPKESPNPIAGSRRWECNNQECIEVNKW